MKIMRIMYSTTRLIFSFSLLVLFSVNLFSQVNMNDAIGAYKGGFQAQQSGNLEAALDSFKLCVSIAKELGEEADDVRIQAENQIPKVNYEMGRKLAVEKDYEKAIVKFLETIDIAKVYGTDDDIKIVTSALGQVYYSQATVLYKQEKFEEALTMCKKSLEIIPGNSRAHYMAALIYRNMDDETNFAEAAKKSGEAAKAERDNKLYESSMKLGRDYFLVKANAAKDAKKYDEAIKHLNTSIEFDSENATTYYMMTQVYSAQKMWDNVINAANKALEYEKSDPTDQAKLYYEIGNAFKEKGENEKACDAFKKASVGAFKESSEYQIKHILKCG